MRFEHNAMKIPAIGKHRAVNRAWCSRGSLGHLTRSTEVLKHRNEAALSVSVPSVVHMCSRKHLGYKIYKILLQDCLITSFLSSFLFLTFEN